MNNTKKLKATILTLLLLAIFVSIISYSAAYFLAELDRTGTHSMVVELIFDRLTVSNGTAIPSGSGTTTAFDSEAEWGTAQNPYVISQKHHVQNLSALQNSGFFADRVDDDGKPIQSYFLVSDTAGKPVVIDCGGMRLSPVGSADNPFTGHINGVVGTTTATYNNYGVSVSTISNLKIEAKEDTPDIGFFGYVGYNGTKTENKDDELAAGSFISCVEDLLFADVEVTSQKSLLEILEDWWKGLNGGTHAHTSDRAETHHVGIIAGHAEFAILRNLSVYYTEEVPAFTLNSNASGSKTNYYSVTGLIGTLKYVNPTVNSDGTVSGSNSVSDSNIFAEGSGGGGGDQTGTMTGYMMAKNIFDMHEKYLNDPTLNTENKPIKDEYDVKEMKKADGSELFSSVEMTEKTVWDTLTGGTGTKKTYYYFQDTIFTFAMSANSSDDEAADYVSKIWDLNNPAEIYGVDNTDKFNLQEDPDGTPMYTYSLTAVDKLEENGHYVIAYFDNKNDDGDTSNDKIYLLNFHIDNTYTYGDNPSQGSWGPGFQSWLQIGDIYNDGSAPVIEYVTTTKTSDGQTATINTGIKSMTVVSANSLTYEYAFKYVSGDHTIQDPADSNQHFGVYMNSRGGTDLDHVDFQRTDFTSKTHSTSVGGFWTNVYDIWVCNWKFTYKDNGKFAISNSFTVTGGSKYTYAWLKFKYDNEKIILDEDIGYNADGTSEKPFFEGFKIDDAASQFTIFKVGERKEITPQKTVVNEGDRLFDFDPSKHVLQASKDENGNIIKTDEGKTVYTIKPIRELNFNDGNGRLLSRLNHIVKLFRSPAENTQFTLFNGKPDDPNGNSNSGGVIYATVGSEGAYYTIPAGMIAFYVKEASVTNPSYVDMIVATNPGKVANGEVGLWRAESLSGWSSIEFELASPDYSFEIPSSRAAISKNDITNNAIKISDYTVDTSSGATKSGSTPTYIFPNGERIFVHNEFTITEPGIYFFGSGKGELSISYFSVTGAANAGSDGTDDGTVIGNIDFVYDNGSNIISVDKKYTGEHLLDNESYTNYYPSYYFAEMLAETGAANDFNKRINKETVYIRRSVSTGSRRLIFKKPQDGKTEMRGLSVYRDELAQENITAS